ncbi:MAG: hypothetical protein ACPG6B_06365 [Oceanihabitans sp.]
MKNFIALLFLLTTSFSFCQSVELIGFKSSNCSEERDLGDSILYKKLQDNKLIIKITAEFNCCGSVGSSVDLKKRLFKKNILN